MPHKTLILLKTLTWLVCLGPIVWLLWCALTNTLGPDPTHTITFATGRTALRLLVISLGITPLRRLFPRLSWIIRFRRLLGLFAFFYATLHLMTWIVLYAGFDPTAMYADIMKRRYVTAGMCAWVLLLPLALTSTNWAIRNLGGKSWNRLHRLVYLAAIAGVTHYWWQVKSGVMTPLGITVVVAILLLARPALSWMQRRRAALQASMKTAAIARSQSV
jgi:methionine sulfoxide reductase heme-binding subunit